VSVLITGGGLVGAQIARIELACGHRPVVYDRAPDIAALADVVDVERCAIVRGDVTDLTSLRAAIDDHAVTRIVHTAAHGGLTVGATADPLPAVRTNVVGTATVLEAARLCSLERVVLCSSTAIETAVERVPETGTDESGSEGRPTTVYAASKRAAEDLGHAYRWSFGLDVLFVRFPAVFGPWRAGGGGHATALMDGWVRAGVAGDPIVLTPTTSTWLYSKDAATATVLACWAQEVASTTFTIGMGAEYPEEALAEAFAAVFPHGDVRVRSESMTASRRAGRSAPDPAAPIDRVRTQLGYAVGYPMVEALGDYRDWVVHSAGDPSARGPEGQGR